jgi:unsaturated rhamnogalacturonyl hydrolase
MKMERPSRFAAVAAILALSMCRPAARAQQPAANDPEFYAGDAPADPGPLASDVSGAINRDAIRHAVRKVADWELARSQPHFNQDWTFAALYRGLISASQATGDAKYENAVRDAARRFQWKLGPRIALADDEAVAQSYMYFYFLSRDPAMIAPTRAAFDQVMSAPENPAKPLWWWCDALFMAPVVWVKLSAATGNPAYTDFMNRQWWITSSLLYDPHDHLYSRDATFLDRREANGQKIYWSRGNGWVLAGLASVIEALPAHDPRRAQFIQQFQQMAARIALLQGHDGLWRPGLLDAASYPLPEVSGSAFFVYGIAWGVHRGLLDRRKYLPVVRAGWRGLTSHIYADGRLGSIQPIGAAPGAYGPSSSYVFGVGAFLMAGAELELIAPKLKCSPARRNNPGSLASAKKLNPSTNAVAPASRLPGERLLTPAASKAPPPAAAVRARPSPEFFRCPRSGSTR